jgi:hypothetical protein
LIGVVGNPDCIFVPPSAKHSVPVYNHSLAVNYLFQRPDEDGRQGKRPRSVGQLLGKSKWEKPLANWIVATGVGLLGPEKQDFEAERMTDGDVSHSSEIKLLSWGTGVGLDLFSRWFSFLLCLLVLRLVLFRLLFPYQWGLIPRMGKTHR